MLEDIFNELGTPVVVVSVIERSAAHGHRAGGAEKDTAVAADAVFLVTAHFVIISVVVVHAKGALVDAHLAPDAPCPVTLD